ncbi:hypothetical protein MRB53_020095 [Persea americana]|uniref:Uncharacterized protein n=1 Tax=Persea americana TaxID=3435 RepID=A0ACC2L192_PERAE|nr:hypothetical protein MRB53_020095 [Persea americana]
MGKRKIEIKKIEDKNKRQVCFSKRRQGLFKKASELCTLCDAQVAIIAFSGGGRPFVFGHPTADTVINRFLDDDVVNEKQQLQLPSNEFNGCEWGDQVFNLGEGVDQSIEELMQLKRELEGLREKVKVRMKDKSTTTSSAADGPQSGQLATMFDEDEWIFGGLSEIDSASYL